MTRNGAKPARGQSLTRLLVQTTVIIGLGLVIGVADAFIRPVKLSRTVEEFGLSTGMEAAGNASGATATARPESGTDGAGPVPVAETPDSVKSASGSSLPTPGAVDDQSGSESGGFQFTPKDRLKPGHITIEEAKRAFDSGQASFVDARSKARFEEGHVPGAVRLELADFISGQPAKLALLPREFMMIVYCGGGDCDESERVAERLEGAGYQRIFIIHDGFPGWKAAGYEFETGPEEFE